MVLALSNAAMCAVMLLQPIDLRERNENLKFMECRAEISISMHQNLVSEEECELS